MIILSRDFVESHIAKVKSDIQGLNGFISLGNELARLARYEAWLAELEAYYAEHYV